VAPAADDPRPVTRSGDRPSRLDNPLTGRVEDSGVMIHEAERIQLAVDCECGMTVEARGDDDLLDELLEHISTAHEADMSIHPPVVTSLANDA
jgi:hypothetical protein